MTVEAVAGDLGLFAEAISARDNTFLGNTPLEYIRAVLEINKQQLDDM